MDWALRSTLAAKLHSGLIAAVLLAAAAVPQVALAAGEPEQPGVIALASLPDEARQIYRVIHAGGPFAYAKDGIVFGNRERHLPPHARGWYREYTVSTPGARDRGARRIVCGGDPPARPQSCYYTADHYTSFRRIAP